MEVWLARILAGFVSGLGAESAESYGRDSFTEESAGLGQLRFALSPEG
jgi:hypothetical protein